MVVEERKEVTQMAYIIRWDDGKTGPSFFLGYLDFPGFGRCPEWGPMDMNPVQFQSKAAAQRQIRNLGTRKGKAEVVTV